MRGANTLTFNKATMIEMAQEYLDKRLVGVKLKVDDVAQVENSRNERAFNISVQELKDPPGS